DDEGIRDALSGVLRDEGYKVETAIHGRQGLELLRAGFRPDAILLDLMLPVMNGWEFRVEQRRDPRIADIPVVAMSADASAKAAAIDAQAYLRKPTDVEVLLATVERVIVDSERQRAERELRQTQLRMATIVETSD